jgi:hypothetical protein
MNMVRHHDPSMKLIKMSLAVADENRTSHEIGDSRIVQPHWPGRFSRQRPTISTSRKDTCQPDDNEGAFFDNRAFEKGRRNRLPHKHKCGTPSAILYKSPQESAESRMIYVAGANVFVGQAVPPASHPI